MNQSVKKDELMEVFERISDAFVALDKNWRYTYMNKKAGEIFGRDPKKMIGRHIRTEFPEGIGQSFQQACEKAMREQQYIYLEEYYPTYDRWFENHIYPSPDGLSIFFKDITEKKKSEAKIEASEKKLRQVLSSTPDNFYVIDRKYNVILINETAEKNLEKAWKKPVKVGTNLLEVIPANGEPIKESFEKVFAGQRVEYELQVSGQELPAWVLVSYMPVHDEKGVITGAYVIAKDISKRKKAEQAIKESEARYRALVENAPEALVVFDVEQKRFVSVSESAVKLFKMPKEELLKVGPIELSPEFQPDGRSSAVVGFEKINQAIAGEKPSFEWTHRDAEGNLIPCEVWLVRLPSETQVLVRGSIIDITGRKKAQELVIRERDLSDSIINSLPGIFYLRDLTQPRCLRWNKNFETILGYTAEEIANSDLLDFIDAKDKPKAWEAVQKAIKDGDVVAIEANVLTKAGSTIPYFITGVYIKYEGFPCLMGTAIDISARKKAEELIIRERDLSDSIINSLPGIFYLRELETGHCLRWNKNFETVMGKTPQEISESQLYDCIADEHKPLAKQAVDVAVITNDSIAIEATLMTRTGPAPYYLTGLPIIYENKACLMGTGTDISARKKVEEELRESEQKYKLLFESNPLPMFMFSRDDFQIIDVNESAIRHYGYSKKEFLAMKVTDMRPAEDVARFLDEVTTPTSKSLNLGIWRHKKKDGSIISVEIIGYDITYQNKPVRLTLANDVTEKLAAEEKLKQSYNEVRRLTNHLQNIREEERTHIAREIHDELGQQLTVLKMDASWLSKKLSTTDDIIKEKLKGLIDLLDGTVKTVRRISSELRPSLLDDLGLTAAIEWHLKEFGKRSGIQTDFFTDETEFPLPEEVKTGLFRIFQESLTNVARHAEAKNVKVTLRKIKDELVLSIEDDGKGFNKFEAADKKTLGVLGMEERSKMMGGNYKIMSEAGKGTVVTVSVPFKLEISQ